MRELRGKFRKREQHEATIRKLRMGKFQTATVNDVVVEQENIEVDLARSPFFGLRRLLTTHCFLDGLKASQQFVRGEIRLYLDYAIDIPVLRIADRFTLVQ